MSSRSRDADPEPVEESVLVVPVSSLACAGVADGFTRVGSRRQVELICDHANEFMPRSICETDERYRQVIPYCVIRDSSKYIFTYTRPPRNAEARLSSRRSLGVGGHVNRGDAGTRPGLAVVRRAMMREVYEETNLDKFEYHWVGFINDTASPVGRVHLGLVVAIDVKSGIVAPAHGNTEMADHQMMDYDSLYKHIEEFEPWSQLTIRGLFPTRESVRSMWH